MSLTREDAATLDRLAQDASDFIGRSVSGSAVLRALLRYADQQSYQWIRANVCPFIETELASGIMLSKKK